MSKAGGLVGRRIVVTGNSCSGKSTLAAHLARALGLTFIELDALFWLPDWQESEAEEFRGKVRQALAAATDGWVAAGNYYARLQDLTWAAADTVIWLDLPLRVTLTRVISRSWRRWRSGELIWGTNREPFWPQLKVWDQDDSLIAFTLKYHRVRHAETLSRMELARGGPAVWHHLRSAAGVESLLERVRAAQPHQRAP